MTTSGASLRKEGWAERCGEGHVDITAFFLEELPRSNVEDAYTVGNTNFPITLTSLLRFRQQWDLHFAVHAGQRLRRPRYTLLVTL
jgi:hypothetical protein